MALGTPWGLFRQYWVLWKFLLVSTGAFLLLLHPYVVVQQAAFRASALAAGNLPNVGPLGTQLVADAGLAIVLLLVARALAVYKPWGLTRYGRSFQQQGQRDVPLPVGLKVFVGGIALIIVVMLALHATGHNPVHHGM